MLAGLRKRDIAQARFALAYVRARLGRFDEAGTVLGDMEKSNVGLDQPAVYLNLYVQSKLNNHERVERIYNESADLLDEIHDTRMIVSISYLGLARMRWARREINGAMHYFDQMRQLEVLADEIPCHIDNHEVVMGTVALFEKNIDDSIKHFQASIDAARQHKKPTFPGELGLLLCEWKLNELPDIDEKMGNVLRAMQPSDESSDETAFIQTECPHCGKPYRVRARYAGRKSKCKSCRKPFAVEALADNSPVDAEVQQEDQRESNDSLLNDDELLLRNTRLWHCVSLLATWMLREEESGVTPRDLKRFRGRLKEVCRIDPEMGDAYLLGGLISYYFSKNNEERSKARAEIDKAVQKDVHVPEVLQLLDRENKLASLAENSLMYYHQLARRYAENSEVDPSLQAQFLRKMGRFERFRKMGEIEIPSPNDAVAPTVENLKVRGNIMRTRLSNIIRYKLTDSEEDIRKELQGGLDELSQHAETLDENTKSFQQKELDLLESTGEFLFHDEPDSESNSQTSGEEHGGKN